MTEGIVVRPMAAFDVSRVLSIESVTFSTPWTEATFRGLLRRSDADLFVADAGGGHLAGYAVCWAVLDQGELGNLCVAAPYRRRGIGRRLLDRVIDRARERGVRELFLEVRESNKVAQELYYSYQFREVGRRRNYYSAPTEDALVLCKLLGEPRDRNAGKVG